MVNQVQVDDVQDSRLSPQRATQSLKFKWGSQSACWVSKLVSFSHGPSESPKQPEQQMVSPLRMEKKSQRH